MTRRSFLRQPARAPDEIPRIKPAPVPKEAVVEFFDNDEFEQGGEAWFKLRLGMPTASVFGTIMANGKDGGESKTRKKLLYQLAGEILTGEPMENYSNAAMQRGKDMESSARAQYAFTRDIELERVGFVRRTLPHFVVGCSPDSLIADDGVLEIKTMAPHLLIELVERGTFPGEHKAQVYGTLWVTGRKWCDLMIFYSGMPISPTFRIQRDEAYLRELSNAVEIFNWELKRLVDKVRAMGGAK